MCVFLLLYSWLLLEDKLSPAVPFHCTQLDKFEGGWVFWWNGWGIWWGGSCFADALCVFLYLTSSLPLLVFYRRIFLQVKRSPTALCQRFHCIHYLFIVVHFLEVLSGPLAPCQPSGHLHLGNFETDSGIFGAGNNLTTDRHLRHFTIWLTVPATGMKSLVAT